jgi:hypothetical protein
MFDRAVPEFLARMGPARAGWRCPRSRPAGQIGRCRGCRVSAGTSRSRARFGGWAACGGGSASWAAEAAPESSRRENFLPQVAGIVLGELLPVTRVCRRLAEHRARSASRLKPLLRVVRGSRKARRKACGGGGRRRHRLGVLVGAVSSHRMSVVRRMPALSRVSRESASYLVGEDERRRRPPSQRNSAWGASQCPVG